VSQAQALTLLSELPTHLLQMATFALATGLRAANVTGLIWDQVACHAGWRGCIRIRRRPGRRSPCLIHDLRHTWASWHIQQGTPLIALQELGGWETERMVRRYAHLAADHLAAFVGNAQIHGTFLAHGPLDASNDEPLTLGYIGGQGRNRIVSITS